ncbi:MAG: E3 ubiquitin protein ligase [Candidatus Heimdallarchaeota archaeon]|nr:E3 ubiquitin protein ligase [Candidatus Heimdallarchaeota archaeon]
MEDVELETETVNPLTHVRPYFSKLKDSEISILIGSILHFKEVKLKLLQELLNMKRLDLEEKIGRLLQSKLIEGHFTSDTFLLSSVNYKFERQSPNLTLDDRIFLAYLKARFKVSIEELQKAFSITFEAVVHILAIYITQGLISSSKVTERHFEFFIHFELPKISADEVSKREKEVIGYAILREQTTFNEISNNLELPEHKVQAIIVDMILSNMILCNFTIHKSKIKATEVIIQIKHFLVLFPQKPVEMMSEIEKLTIGYINLRKTASLRELSSVLNTHRASLLQVVARLTATREIPFNMSTKGFLKPLKPYKATRVIPIDQLVASSLFNYRVLLGLIGTEKRINVKTIMKKMGVKRYEAIKGIIDLYISGQIDGAMRTAESFELTNIAKITSIHSIALESWERIILGALISEQVISWPKIAALLQLDRETAREKAYVFISRGIANAVAKDSVLTLTEIPKLPPLVQVTDLPQLDQEILGLILMKEKISLKEIRSKFALTAIQAYSKIYLIIGSGLLVAETTRKSIRVIERRQPQPNIPINELEKNLQSTIQAIESAAFKNNRISMNELSKNSIIHKDDLINNLSILIARGYYDGKLVNKYFVKSKQLFRIKAKPQCFECNTIITEVKDPCPKCNAMLPLCTVCKGPLLVSDFIVACPYCSHESHSTHIKEWLKIKGECPVCKNSLNPSQLVSLNH